MRTNVFCLAGCFTHTLGTPSNHDLGYAFTDLVRNQLEDTARIRNMTKEQVITDVLLRDQPTKRFVEPDDIGALVAHLCGAHSSSITGACLSIDGGWTAR